MHYPLEAPWVALSISHAGRGAVLFGSERGVHPPLIPAEKDVDEGTATPPPSLAPQPKSHRNL